MIVKEKAYAKINLALAVTGESNGFHTLDSLVTTVDLFDTVTVKTRKDYNVSVTPKGLSEYVYNHNPQRDNVYKAVKAFMQEFGVTGADVTVHKRIPISSGMGGSSTDVSAVLRALQRAYKTQGDLTDIANSLGSDTAYLLKGGFARLQGRGEIITPLNLPISLSFAVIFCDGGVDTATCFKLFDEMQKPSESGAIARLIDSFQQNSPDYSLCVNHLTAPAIKINPKVKEGLDALKQLSPRACFMTGSGSAVCAIFDCEQLSSWAVQKLKNQGFNAIAVKNI